MRGSSIIRRRRCHQLPPCWCLLSLLFSIVPSHCLVAVFVVPPTFPLNSRNSSMSQRRRLPVQKSGAAVQASSRLRGGSGDLVRCSATVFDNAIVYNAVARITTLNGLGYLINLFSSTHKHVDLLGTLAFAAGAWPGLLIMNQRIRVSTVCVLAWSLRLCAYLVYRVIFTGGDARLDDLLSSRYYALGFWLYSAAWGVICSLPHMLGMSSPLTPTVQGNVWAYIAVAMFLVGWSIEVVADWQKWTFKRNRNERSAYCDVGLWKLSQHPNWFGNILLWTGIFVLNAPSLIEPATRGTQKSIWRTVWRFKRLPLAFLGPLFMYNLFHGQATGRLLGDSLESRLERYGYGINMEYTNYIDNTPLIFPSLPE